MNADELTSLILNGPMDRLVKAIGPLPEAERKKLSKVVSRLRKEAAKVAKDHLNARSQSVPCPQCGKPLRSGLAQQCFQCGARWQNPNQPKPLDHAAEQRLKLAVLGIAAWTEAQRIRLRDVSSREHLYQVLADRKPEWLSKWIDKELSDDFADWGFLRRFIRDKLCSKPTSENYVLRMLQGMYRRDGQRTLRDYLLEDSSLLSDEVWRIFEISPARGTILPASDITNLGQEGLPFFSWGKGLFELSAEGKLDRRRLLAVSLGSLQRNTEARNTGWFQKFHELLEPTADERRNLQATYLQLLSHPVPAVVGMALDALAVLSKAKSLDEAGLLDAVGPVFHVQSKAQPLTAVKLLARTATDKKLAPRLAEVLLSGLSHPAVQVQEAILKLLDKIRESAADVIASSLPVQIEHLAPSLQEQARKLLAEETATSPVVAVAADDLTSSEWIEQARQVPSPWREMAGIDTLIRAIEGDGELAAVAFDPMAVPRLYPDQRVQPIETLDELIDRLTVAVEGLDDAIEFELLIDGLSRLCDQRPVDFQARVAPLLLRVEKLISPQPSAYRTITSGGLQMALFKLVLRWCGREVGKVREESDYLLGFLDVRLEIVAKRVRSRLALPLVACPTHRQGWIDPCEMTARLEIYQERKLEPAKEDFIQALLRLAPDGRSDALASSTRLQGPFANAFRYALGGPAVDVSWFNSLLSKLSAIRTVVCGAPSAAAVSAPILISAGRARAPFAELTELAALDDGGGPDAIHLAAYAWKVENVRDNTGDIGTRVAVSAKPEVPATARICDFPTTLMHPVRNRDEFSWVGQTGLNRWKATVWPLNLDSYFATGARIDRGRYIEAPRLRQRAIFLGPLFEPETPFSEMAQLLLAMCLNEQAPETTGLAVDALVELIRDGRCVGTELGAVLGRMLSCNFIKLNRLGKQLETAARASLLHAHVCGQIVQITCAPLTEAPKDLHYLLSPLLEWLSALEQGINDGLRPLLKKVTTGKTGALAKKLLALRGTPNQRRVVFLEALQGRLRRAERWAG